MTPVGRYPPQAGPRNQLRLQCRALGWCDDERNRTGRGNRSPPGKTMPELRGPRELPTCTRPQHRTAGPWCQRGGTIRLPRRPSRATA